MKIFSIPTFTKISDRMFERHIANQQKNVSKYIQFPQTGFEPKFQEQLETGALGIANYLKHNKMFLRVTPEYIAPKETGQQFVRFSLFNLKNKKPVMAVNIPADFEKNYKSFVQHRVMIPIHTDETEVVMNVPSVREDNLLRHIYRVVSDMVEHVKAGGEIKK